VPIEEPKATGEPILRREGGSSIPNSQFSIHSNVALVCLFGICAVTPLLKGSLPQTADGIIHLYRLVELDNLFQNGVLFSRWAPDLVYGLGLPLFNFYAPLSYYLVEIFHLLGLSLVNALQAAFCLAMLGSGASMYLYVRDVFGETPAIVAAVAYMYAPYQLYDSFFRGILPEVLVMALFPLVMWSFRRLATLEDGRYIVIGALGLAALPLTHTTSALILLPLLVAYVVGLLLLKGERKLTGGTVRPVQSRVANHRNCGVALALVLGMALSAFFTLPAVLERQWIQIERGLIPPNLDYHHHFLSLAEILSPPQPTDTGRMNPAVPRSLGLVQIIPAIAAIPGLRKKGDSRRIHILFFALVLMASVAMMLPQSVALWDRLPPLAYLQFPFRWLVPASLAVAVLTGASVGALSHSSSLTSPRFLVSAILLTLLVLAALPMLYPGYQHSLPANPSLAEMMDMERRMGVVGTTATGEYLPIWVEWVPPESLLEPMYRAGLPLKRLDTSTWPEGSTVLEEEYTPTTSQLTVQITKILKVFFDIHYFPGWRAYIDGEEVPIEPTQGQGRISFVVPAGKHVIRLQFEELPLRMAADAISVISLLVLLAINGSRRYISHQPARTSDHRRTYGEEKVPIGERTPSPSWPQCQTGHDDGRARPVTPSCQSDLR